jgi:hypothetical protein
MQMEREMNGGQIISTWEVLQELGFQPDPNVYSDVRPGLSFDFGNFVLTASCVMNLRFAAVVLFGGCLVSPRSISEVAFEMPRRIACRDICAAWIVWHLDGHAGGMFVPAREVPWVIEGRLCKRLLPWVIQREELRREHERYLARPSCSVQREWIKLGLRSLAKILEDQPDQGEVRIEFDGRVLRFVCAGNIIPMSASGPAWSVNHVLPVASLRILPKRLMCESVDVSIWEERLIIDRHGFAGVHAIPREGNLASPAS